MAVYLHFVSYLTSDLHDKLRTDVEWQSQENDSSHVVPGTEAAVNIT